MFVWEGLGGVAGWLIIGVEGVSRASSKSRRLVPVDCVDAGDGPGPSCAEPCGVLAFVSGEITEGPNGSIVESGVPCFSGVDI